MIGSAFTIALAGLAGIAAASPITPHYPRQYTSKGFNLIVNVTDPSRDFTPSIHNTYVASIHIGAGQGLVGQVASPKYARLFYQNGTAEEVRFGNSHLLTDAGSIVEGFGLVKDAGSKTLSTATINGGSGDKGIVLTAFPNPYSVLAPETFVACNESLPYYNGKPFILIKQAQTTVDKKGNIHKNIPQGCAPVTLIPQCKKLNALPEGSLGSHEFAADSSCYKNVASIDWSKYGP